MKWNPSLNVRLSIHAYIQVPADAIYRSYTMKWNSSLNVRLRIHAYIQVPAEEIMSF